MLARSCLSSDRDPHTHREHGRQRKNYILPATKLDTTENILNPSMPRNKQFRPDREPLSHHSDLALPRENVSGPFLFLNPTLAYFTPSNRVRSRRRSSHTTLPVQAQLPPSLEKHTDAHRPPPPPPTYTSGTTQTETPPVEHIWRSRDNRKGRHALRVDYNAPSKGIPLIAPRPTTAIKAIAEGILRMFTTAPIWDVSWLVAFTFVLGSMIWILNSFFVWLPLVAPSTEFAGEVLQGGGITGFLGATVFEFGSVLLLLEAVNDHQTGCFGWALETELNRTPPHVPGDTTPPTVTSLKPQSEKCTHHHVNRRNLIGETAHSHASNWMDFSNGYTTTSPSGSRSFRWLPSWNELKTHYIYELGFLASVIQFIAATIFWVAGFTGLPGILNHLSQAVTNGIYWVPQIMGGVGFIASGLLFTLETQEKWYKPAFHVLGWYIGAWNFIGGIGFTLCGALGPASRNSGVDYQATLATFWGSWAFMIGSTLQWYESLQKYPVERKRGSR